MRQLTFGELECFVLKTVRDIGRVTVRDVYSKFDGKRSYTTLMTVMSRLAQKGDLTREKEGKHYVYWITPQNESSSKGLLKRIQEKIFDGKGAAMVSYLLEVNQEISDQELQEIENMIRKKREKNKEHE